MKTSSACPKCQSQDIIHVADDAANRIQTGLTVFGYVPVARYVCASCGFCEEYVESADDIEVLRRKFARH